MHLPFEKSLSLFSNSAIICSMEKRDFFFSLLFYGYFLVGIPKIKRKQIVARFKPHNPIFSSSLRTEQ